jgi:large subunit ribosomal protein L21
MYAILSHGGRQYRVSAGDRLLVDRLDAEIGSIVALAPVLLTGGDGATVLGKDVDGVRVAVTVVGHRRGRKLRIFKYKAKKRSRKMAGYRSDLTELRVDSILAKGAAVPKAVSTAEDGEGRRDAGAREPGGSAPKARRAPAAKATTAAPVSDEDAADDEPARATAPARRRTAPRASAAAAASDLAADDSSAAAGPKPSARTGRAAPRARKRPAAAADDKETGDGA